MNLFNETIYKNHLEHSQKGQTWDKHKYLYITPSGRYVYPSDLENVKTSSNPALAKQRNARKIAAASENAYKDQIRSAHQGSALRNDNSISRSKRIDSSGWRTQAIANASGQQYSKQIEAQKRAAEARAAAAKTSGVAAGSKSVATPATRNTITIKKTETTPAKTEEKKTTATTATTPKTEEKKTETTTSTDGDKYKNMSEEMKEYLKKEAAKGEKKEEKSTGKKGSGGSKKKGSSSKASTKTEEASKMGLSDDDLKNMEVNTQATDREEVLKNIALRVIRGDYGNGADRKAKLGNYYDEVQKRVNELMKSGSIQREGQPAQQTSQKTDQKASTSSSQKEAKMEQYKDGDKDFDDKNYSEKNRLGNTDFFSYKRNDGKYVILEEDMKWVVDEKPSSKTIKNLEAFDKYVADKRKNGDKYTSDDWEKMASQAINGIDFTERTKKKTVKHVDPLNEDNFLMHWGKKHRSGRFKFGSGNRPYQHEARNHSWYDRRTMSNEDLKEAIARSRMELDLYNNERNNRSASQKFVEDVITSVGKSVIIGAASGALKYAGREFVSKALENEDLANAMFGGGGGGKKKGKKNKK